MQRGDVSFKILEFIKNASVTTAEILDLFILDYHTHYRRLRGLPERRWKPKPRPRDFSAEERQRLYSIIFWLKKDGLIKKNLESKWVLTQKGKERKDRILDRMRNLLPKASYAVLPSSDWKIIIFDIPEKEKRKREWLRSALKNLGFKMLQKSVWIGKLNVPESFINDLSRLGILSAVEILAITRSGSLRRVSIIK